MQLIVDDLLLQYELTGKGRLVLLLHGWGDSARGLSALQAELDKTYQVLSLDLPGFGASQSPREVWNLDNYATFVSRTIEKLKLSQPYAIIGHSNGGALAIRAISQAKLRPHKLVLLAASGVRDKHTLRRLLFKIIAKTGNALTFWLPEHYRRQLRKKLYGVAGSDMLVVPQLQETFKKTVRQDVQQDATKLTQPTLLVYAQGDPAVPVEVAFTYNKLIKGSRLEVLDSDNHFIHLDKPEKVTQLIKEFLK